MLILWRFHRTTDMPMLMRSIFRWQKQTDVALYSPRKTKCLNPMQDDQELFDSTHRICYSSGLNFVRIISFMFLLSVQSLQSLTISAQFTLGLIICYQFPPNPRSEFRCSFSCTENYSNELSSNNSCRSRIHAMLSENKWDEEDIIQTAACM